MKYLLLPLIILFINYGCTRKQDNLKNEISTGDKKSDTLKSISTDIKPISGNSTPCDKYKLIKDSIINMDKDSVVVYSITYPMIDGIEDVNKKTLINTQLKKAASTGFESEEGADLLDKKYAADRAKELIKEKLAFNAEVSYDVKHCKNDLLSVCFMYLGIQTTSAHPMAEFKCINLDLATGDILTLERIFKKGTDFKKIVTDHLKRDMEKKNIPYSDPDNFKTSNYYLTDTAIGLPNLYSSHAMASYELVIPINDVRNAMDESVLKMLGLK